MDVPIRDHLMAAIAHLGLRRARLITELNTVEVTIDGLRREVESMKQMTSPIPFPLEAGESTVQIYSGMSVRWSVLMFLSSHDTPLATVGVIADELRKGGMSSKGQNFNSNVSAVLSQMNARGEVEKLADRFVLTAGGRDAWEHIKQSDKFKNRLTLAATEEN